MYLRISKVDLVYLLPGHGDEGHFPDEGHRGQDGDDEAKENRFQPFIRNLFELPQMSRISVLLSICQESKRTNHLSPTKMTKSKVMKFVRTRCRTVRLVTAWGGRKGILRAWGVLTMNIVGAVTFFNAFGIE